MRRCLRMLHPLFQRREAVVALLVGRGELKPFAQDAKIEVPAEFGSSRQAMLDRLKGLRGEDFVKQYHSDQNTGHKQAASLFERYAKGGENDSLKSWAGKILPHLEEHYNLTQDLDEQEATLVAHMSSPAAHFSARFLIRETECQKTNTSTAKERSATA